MEIYVPNEIIFIILMMSHPMTFIALAQTCKRFNDCARHLKKKYIKRYFIQNNTHIISKSWSIRRNAFIFDHEIYYWGKSNIMYFNEIIGYVNENEGIVDINGHHIYFIDGYPHIVNKKPLMQIKKRNCSYKGTINDDVIKLSCYDDNNNILHRYVFGENNIHYTARFEKGVVVDECFFIYSDYGENVQYRINISNKKMIADIFIYFDDDYIKETCNSYSFEGNKIKLLGNDKTYDFSVLRY